ncbi:nudix hydrolase 10-like isoform X2 [Pyrus x bretschneideri]|uniref:nudix hydrolase 10-like isoform X2 n=1 Tax=Pyrus x bretschneideri TaxID=225117 RepID=UPI0020301460|nr:nudix hydrolase 10-like isoform X2 [Pyrus x bretschneideri]
MAAQTESRGGGGGEVKKLLSAVNDHYGCVIVHVTQHMDPATFVSSLTSSIAHWKLQGKKGVSIRLAIERVNLVEAAVKITYDILGRSELQEGFWYTMQSLMI